MTTVPTMQRLDDRSLLARIRMRGLTIKKRRRKTPPAIYPSAIEMAYRRDLREITRLARTILRAKLDVMLPRIFDEARTLTRSDSESRADDYATIISQVFGEIRIEFERSASSRSRAASQKAGQRVAEHTKRELDKQIKTVVGIDILQDESWLASFVDGFVAQNAKLITTIPERYFADIEAIVRDAALSGRRHEDLANEFEERFDVSESRAALLARDQVSKLNGDITQVRQVRLGIKKFVWSTSMDERVRPSHKAKEGKTYDWSKPPSDTGKPGDDYQCRCVALPDFSDILGDGDE